MATCLIDSCSYQSRLLIDQIYGFNIQDFNGMRSGAATMRDANKSRFKTPYVNWNKTFYSNVFYDYAVFVSVVCVCYDNIRAVYIGSKWHPCRLSPYGEINTEQMSVLRWIELFLTDIKIKCVSILHIYSIFCLSFRHISSYLESIVSLKSHPVAIAYQVEWWMWLEQWSGFKLTEM